MPDKNTKAIVEQIYNFVTEKHGIQNKSRFMQLSLFFNYLHEGDESTFTAIKPYNYQGVFNGSKQIIYGNAAPDIFDKENFIEWTLKSIDG